MTREVHLNPLMIFYVIIAGMLSLLIYNDQIVVAGRLLAVAFGLTLMMSFFSKNQAVFFTSIIFVLSPFLAFLRQYVISYNGASIILITALVLWILKDKGRTFWSTISDRRVFGVCIFMAGFVIYGIIGNVPLANFMKYVETTLAVLIFSMVLNYLPLVKKHLIYFIASSILVILSLLQHIETRYMFKLGEESIKADPSAYSIGLVLATFFLLEGSGSWAFNKSGVKADIFRYIVLVAVVTLTFLTTSRIGFFTLIGTYLIFFVISRASIKKIMPIVLAILFGVILIINSKYADISGRWFDKTFNNERGIASASSGRSDQWKMAGYYLVNGPISSILFGYGPGKALSFTKDYTRIVPGITTLKGKQMQLHSLYLNVMIEFGLIAFVFLMWFLINRWKAAYKLYKLYGISIPLLALIGYMIYIGSVSGLGIVPGMFIALFLATPDKLLTVDEE